MFLEFAANDDGTMSAKQQCDGIEFAYELRSRGDVGAGRWDCEVTANGNPFRSSAVFDTYEEALSYGELTAGGVALGDFAEEMSQIPGYSPRNYDNE